GYSLNERSSFTLGYKHDFIDETETEINDTVFDSRSLDVGALLIGWAYGWTDRVTSNVNLELGITEDAPDVQISLRVPLVAYRP
ncbi:MAG: transporter, partial [Gammaproteobacteria bacterium]